MKPSERIQELERIIEYREKSVPNHRKESIAGWMYEKQIKEHISDLKEIVQLKAENEAYKEVQADLIERAKECTTEIERDLRLLMDVAYGRVDVRDLPAHLREE